MENVEKYGDEKVLSSMDNDAFSGSERSDLAQVRRWVIVFQYVAWFLVIVGVSAFIYGIAIKFINPYMLHHELGDFIGGVSGALWGLAGLVFIYIAFLGQKEQLIYQRVELRQTRKEFQEQKQELAGQRKQLELQNEYFERQIRLSVYPRLHINLRQWDGYSSDHRPHIEARLSNIGEEAATNMEVYLMGKAYGYKEVYDEDGEVGDVIETLDCEVIGYTRLSLFASGRTVKLAFPVDDIDRHGNLSLLLQFRDILGENYICQYDFSRETIDPKKREYGDWSLISVEPSTVQSYPRMKTTGHFPADREMTFGEGTTPPDFIEPVVFEEIRSTHSMSLFKMHDSCKLTQQDSA